MKKLIAQYIFLYLTSLLPIPHYQQAWAEELHVANKLGDLALEVVVTENTDFINSWVSESSSKAVHVTRLRKITRNQTVHTAFLVSGYSVGKDGQYNFKINWRLIRPDGKLTFDEKSFASGHRPSPRLPSFVIADRTLELKLDSTDPLGRYILEATVEDLVAGINAKSEYLFELVNEDTVEEKSGSKRPKVNHRRSQSK